MSAEERTPARELNPKKRLRNFEEVLQAYSREEAMREAERCLQCRVPRCVDGCPVAIVIPSFIMAIKEGELAKANSILKESNFLPAITGRVCPQEEQCEGSCVRGAKGESVAIGKLERFVADWARENVEEEPRIEEPRGKSVAVVGSGPAGLTCAAQLATMGYKVKVFEALHRPGGVLTYGIPDFRLPSSIVEAEVEYVESLGVEMETDVLIGKSLSVEELLGSYDALFLGTGAGLPRFLGLEGENLNGVYSANEFLFRTVFMKAHLFPEYDTPVKVGRKVAVIGGGNVALDSARSARRMGAEVTIFYRRSEEEMPAREEEIEHAKQEGVKFEFLTSPIAFHGNSRGKLERMECIRMELGEPDSSGRGKSVPREGSEFSTEVDNVIIAVGQVPNPLVPMDTGGLETTRHGTLVTDELGRTTLKRVFAGGDAASGQATVIAAMGQGKLAAKAIHEQLK